MNRTNKKVFESLKLFLTVLAIYLISGISFLIIYGKRESFLILNSLHTKQLDLFFKYFTNIGDGLFAIMISLIMFCFRKLRLLSLVLLIAYASSGIIAQIIKHIIESPRPKLFFNDESLLHIVDGISLMGSNSFPSGHTTTAFAIVTALALFTENKLLQLSYLLTAMLVGFSRIYLSQHFPADVLAGAFLGTATSIFVFLLVSSSSRLKKSKIFCL